MNVPKSTNVMLIVTVITLHSKLKPEYHQSSIKAAKAPMTDITEDNNVLISAY